MRKVHPWMPSGLFLVLSLALCLAGCGKGDAGSQTADTPPKLDEIDMSQYEPVVKNAEAELRKFYPAQMPVEARDKGIKGTVLVRAQVLPDGTVGQVVLEQGLEELCDATALTVAKRCLFLPKRENGKAVESWYTLTYRFQ